MVVSQREALTLYLEALLHEPQEAPPSPPSLAEVLQPALPPVVMPLFMVPEVPTVEVTVEAVEAPVVEASVVPEAVVEAPQMLQAPEVDVVSPQAEAQALVAAAPPPGVPEWAAAPFQALLFRVSGLTLAVPLAGLSGVEEWDEGTVTPMLGRIEWYLGLMAYRGRQVPVVDTAQLVLPVDRMAQLLKDDTGRLGHVVFIQGGEWGLACDAVAEVVNLNHEMVKWRTSRSKRRWLAGTVLEQMCAIIDPPAFAEMLRTGMPDQPEAGV